MNLIDKAMENKGIKPNITLADYFSFHNKPLLVGNKIIRKLPSGGWSVSYIHNIDFAAMTEEVEC